MKLVHLLAVVSIIACSSSALAQRPDLDNPINFGRRWQSWSDQNRSIFMTGYVEGGSDVFQVAFFSPGLTAAGKEQLRVRTATLYDSDLLRDVMTDLYRDPANALVRFGAMVLIARDKLSGKDIEPALRVAREKERAYPPLK